MKAGGTRKTVGRTGRFRQPAKIAPLRPPARRGSVCGAWARPGRQRPESLRWPPVERVGQTNVVHGRQAQHAHPALHGDDSPRAPSTCRPRRRRSRARNRYSARVSSCGPSNGHVDPQVRDKILPPGNLQRAFGQPPVIGKPTCRGTAARTFRRVRADQRAGTHQVDVVLDHHDVGPLIARVHRFPRHCRRRANRPPEPSSPAPERPTARAELPS